MSTIKTSIVFTAVFIPDLVGFCWSGLVTLVTLQATENKCLLNFEPGAQCSKRGY